MKKIFTPLVLALCCVLAMLFSACSSVVKSETEPFVSLQGTWFVDSITNTGCLVNEKIVFYDSVFIWYKYADGDEYWAGKQMQFRYEINNQQIYISYNGDMHSKKFTYSTEYMLCEDKHLILYKFSTDGVLYRYLKLKKN